MNITLMAHDKKKELMVQFCTAYKSVLAKHTLSATATTGRLVAARAMKNGAFQICPFFPKPSN